LMLYVPGGSAGTVYNPCSLVIVSRATLVAVLVTVMFVPGSTALPWSTMRPLIVAVACANSVPVESSNSNAPRETRWNTGPPLGTGEAPTAHRARGSTDGLCLAPETRNGRLTI